MPDKLKYVLLLLICFAARIAVAQQYPPQRYDPNNPNRYNPNNPNQQRYGSDTATRSGKALTSDQMIDTLRKREQRDRDTVIFTSKFIKVTNESLLRDSTQLFAIDTTLANFENYSQLFQPRSPKISLGGTEGLATRSLLFESAKTIGFDVGLHALDLWLLKPEDIQYYNARVPYTLMSLYTAGSAEQIFKVIHTQNIKPNWNVGVNLNFIGSRGFYSSNRVLGQNVSDLNAAVFTWYASKNKRYNLLANAILNNLKSPETGSILNDSVFTSSRGSFDKSTETVRLPNNFENWKTGGIYIKQFYYIGRIDTTIRKNNANILPTQKVSYTLNYNVTKYDFLQNDVDTYHVFPDYYFSSNRSRDSLTVTHVQNDFGYSFYLRGKSNQFVKNELKLDLGLTHDLYGYTQFVSDTTVDQYGNKLRKPDKKQDASFQNITIKGKLSYRFSDRVNLEATVNQIAVGHNFGDFLYDAKALLAGSNKAGKIILDGYVQSSSPSMVATNWVSNHYIFNNKFANQKTTSVSFNYINNALQLDLKAEYFLIADYLYFEAQPGGVDAHPVQVSNNINLLKVSFGKNLSWRNLHFDNYIVYEKTDYQSTLRVPEVYTYSSLYYNAFLFKQLHMSTGVNVRYNTTYTAPSYAVGLGQFYNGPDVTFSSYPVATVFLKGTIKQTNLFVMYDYANQGLFSKGYYTVNRYPQQDHALKFGVSWMFFQ
ncbi:putative porin [Mucilaginibacter sp. UR6-11]|uniref:putative porin n=1 Tax=Mucilaginibacter sp. UR6-11 TaxID=1435644 RepID=UPI001E578C63|nr:putative porin [Mucilaginibacter sp. UR6-11]MCC8425681.1 putative porin [Mucilaginibacter sp. UR6-11]